MVELGAAYWLQTMRFRLKKPKNYRLKGFILVMQNGMNWELHGMLHGRAQSVALKDMMYMVNP